jgi:predicted aspartyl protease
MKKTSEIIPLDLIEIDEDGYHLMINIKIGRKKARLLVDTGASKTVFDETRLMKILGDKGEFETSEHLSTGLGTNKMESQTSEIKSLKIGSLKIKDLQVVVLDLSHVNVSYQLIGEKGIDGVLGSDLLNKLEAVIYYKKPRLKIYY